MTVGRPPVRALPAIIMETLHYAERKHLPDVRNYHLMQSFHVNAAAQPTRAPAAAARDPLGPARVKSMALAYDRNKGLFADCIQVVS